MRILTEGIPAPPELNAALIQQQLSQFVLAWQLLLQPLAETLPALAHDIQTNVAVLMATTDLTLKEATQRVLVDAIRDAHRLYAQGGITQEELKARLNALDALLSGVGSLEGVDVSELDSIKGSADQQQKTEEEIRQE